MRCKGSERVSTAADTPTALPLTQEGMAVERGPDGKMHEAMHARRMRVRGVGMFLEDLVFSAKIILVCHHTDSAKRGFSVLSCMASHITLFQLTLPSHNRVTR